MQSNIETAKIEKDYEYLDNRINILLEKNILSENKALEVKNSMLNMMEILNKKNLSFYLGEYSHNAFYEHSSSLSTTVQVLLYLSDVTITNSKKIVHTMSEVYYSFTYNLQFNSITTESNIFRLSATAAEIASDYVFSHSSKRYSDNIKGGQFCYGRNGETNRLLQILDTKGFNSLVFSAFLTSLNFYLKWESISGVPYRHIKNISLHNSYRPISIRAVSAADLEKSIKVIESYLEYLVEEDDMYPIDKEEFMHTLITIISEKNINDLKPNLISQVLLFFIDIYTYLASNIGNEAMHHIAFNTNKYLVHCHHFLYKYLYNLISFFEQNGRFIDIENVQKDITTPSWRIVTREQKTKYFKILETPRKVQAQFNHDLYNHFVLS